VFCFGKKRSSDAAAVRWGSWQKCFSACSPEKAAGFAELPFHAKEK